ncbi:hypothetical protein NQ314_000987 [Rhamnusium bicolor]|uniref:CHK kinase-like domain-containing protein n=1 Tax=Rhamnusium bicolor TaxID=1586634 RepID=A0AAV8ZTM1_9CUCU|nr:hypothetical protein NQ314_000987 [Rhamnusium bicolor]
MIEHEDSLNENDISEEILREDIAQAVGKKLGTTNFVILNYTLEPITQRLGLLGDHSILYTSLLNPDGEEKQLSFFVKYFPKLEAPAKFAEGIGAFKREMFIYELFEVFTKSGINMISTVTPRCYVAQYNKYLILDNLISEGFDTFDKHKTLDYNCVLIVLQSLARLHASSIIYEEKNLLSWVNITD